MGLQLRVLLREGPETDFECGRTLPIARLHGPGRVGWAFTGSQEHTLTL